MDDKSEKIDRKALSGVLGLPIPEDCEIEFHIRPRGGSFKGLVVFQQGEMVEKRRLSNPIEVKGGIIGNMWPG